MMKPILFFEYKWEALGLFIKLEDFSDYEAITSIIKITNGNFRLIQRLFSQIEKILEINELDTNNNRNSESCTRQFND